MYHLVDIPLIHLVSKPTGRLVSRPRGIGADRGVGKGKSSSAAGNGDWFADDRGDIGEYIDEGNRHVVRPRFIHSGRGGRSSGYGNGDQFVEDQRFSDVMRECRLEAACRANEAGCGIPMHGKKSKAGRENKSTFVEGQVLKHNVGSIRIDQHRLRMDKYSDLMEEKYGADRECHPPVGDREIWERFCSGPCKKG
nr:hypothetical protein [Tanacetum cinerariifolium]